MSGIEERVRRVWRGGELNTGRVCAGCIVQVPRPLRELVAKESLLLLPRIYCIKTLGEGLFLFLSSFK